MRTDTENNWKMKRPIIGYTGFIPRHQHYFAKNYAEICRDALLEFEADQRRRCQISSEDPPTIPTTLPQIKPQIVSTPLTVSKKSSRYKPVDPWKPLGSPYSMEENSPHKYFISGFTGHVPKTRFLFGTSYPITTNKALIQFGKERKVGHFPHRMSEDSSDRLPPIPTINTQSQGMMPHYTGHVPGYKFRYGQTFGQLTRNSLARA